jgi:hypothetical protein
MKLPKELTPLAQLTDTRFQPKWEFLRITHIFLILFGRCYESLYQGHVIRYYKDCYWTSENHSSRLHIEKRIKLFHSRPLNLGLQCYFNVSQISMYRLSGGECRNLFASKVRNRLKGLQCYAAETGAAQALLSRSKTTEALGKLMDLVQNLSSGRFVVVDDGVMIFFFKTPDQKMLDTLHQLSTTLSESPLLPSKRTYWSLNFGYLLGTLAFLTALTVLMIVMRREGLSFADLFP